MWKATTTVPKQPVKPQDDDDDWDSDPNFVNDVSEKDQRWGRQKTLPLANDKEYVNFQELRKEVVNAHENLKKTELGDDRKKAYQTPGQDQTTR
ncbi:Hematopoietic lineage cell-specific protein [Chytridiales sp. JEL 0842]|nr:Hematopoietic lineage cell-specific protein [Chytridiales sp. JEL 0842]